MTQPIQVVTRLVCETCGLEVGYQRLGGGIGIVQCWFCYRHDDAGRLQSDLPVCDSESRDEEIAPDAPGASARRESGACVVVEDGAKFSRPAAASAVQGDAGARQHEGEVLAT